MQEINDLRQQADALAESIEALSDPDKVAACVMETAAADEAARKVVRAAKSKADQTLKSGNYVYTSREYGNVRITASNAVYVAHKAPGKNKGETWHRVKGKAAGDLLRMVAREQQQPLVTA